MANLLPPKQLQMVTRERRMRIVVVVLVFLTAVEILGIVFLVPSFMVARAKNGTTAQQVATVTQLIAQKEQDEAAATLREMRAMLADLETVAAHPRATGYLARIGAHAGALVELNRFVYTIYDEGMTSRSESAESPEATSEEATPLAELVVSGTAENREALLAFVRRIERDEVFRDVELPVSHLAERINIPFTMSLAIVSPASDVLTEE